ncbi:MAG: hypothetical protein JW837_11020 [Sedimentisphaerales bacterium]|nr:hypothetical protein [Sedimentisphaerales bacterium]
MLEKKITGFLLCLIIAVGCSATKSMAENILFIVNDPTEATFQSDALIKDFLEGLGHTVTYFDDSEDEAATEAAAEAADLVFISESVGSGDIREEITEIETPMIITECWAWDEMGLTSGGGAGQDVSSTDIDIVNPGHLLAAGLSGTVTVLTDITGSEGNARFSNGIAGDEAAVIATATLADGQTYDVIFVYDKGAKLAVPPTDGSGQTAADIRICIGFDYQSYSILNENGFALIEAAVRYVFGVKPQARNPQPTDGSYYKDVWANLTWKAGDLAVSHDVYFSDNFDDVNDGAESAFQGNQTETFLIVGFPGFAFSDGLVPGTTYYWRVDEINENESNSPWKGPIWSFTIPPKTAYEPVPADGDLSVPLNTFLSWTAGFGTKLHTIYFEENFEDINSATIGTPVGSTSYDPGTLQLAKTYYWRVDEFDAIETHKGQVWSFTTEGGVSNPDPANRSINVTQTPVLTWSSGVHAASYEVYFGTDAEAVKNADTSSPEHKAGGNLGSEAYETGQLDWNTTYYWRIDEANSTNADSPWTGPLWSFTTANFLIIDDFESYNNLDPTDPASNRIFNAWIDGFDDPTNGSLVGYDVPPFAEQTLVHGGSQSMPLAYDNSVGKSEATLTLTTNRNWTVNNVNTLTIWFRGSANNAAESLYLTLNGNAVVGHDNPDAALITTWTRWNIDLTRFADLGVNLTNVNSITIGLNSVTGGSGTMYFDDIRLYP